MKTTNGWEATHFNLIGDVFHLMHGTYYSGRRQPQISCDTHLRNTNLSSKRRCMWMTL